MENKVLVNIDNKQLLNKIYNDIKTRVRPLYVSNKKELKDIVSDFEEGKDAIGEVIQVDLVDDALQVIVKSDVEINKLRPLITLKDTEVETESATVDDTYDAFKGFILGGNRDEE